MLAGACSTSSPARGQLAQTMRRRTQYATSLIILAILETRSRCVSPNAYQLSKERSIGSNSIRRGVRWYTGISVITCKPASDYNKNCTLYMQLSFMFTFNILAFERLISQYACSMQIRSVNTFPDFSVIGAGGNTAGRPEAFINIISTELYDSETAVYKQMSRK